jgi:cell division septation protein DedD
MKKTRNIILGLIIVAALAIILLPFFQHNQEIAPDTRIAAAPPFPGQSPAVAIAPELATTKIQLKQDDIIQPSTSAWVVQIGSYKSKENALRIVNQLRANGYHAFIQEISTSFEKATRVYVGPEPKQAHAETLAHRLQAEMNLKGVVVSYQPLTL